MIEVYLGGPIKGKSFTEATAWRMYMQDRLNNYATILSPMRYKEKLRYLSTIDESELNLINCPFSYNSRVIVARDRYDVQCSDILFMNLLGAQCVTIGTCVEYGWATATEKKKIIITAIEDSGNPNDHWFIRELSDWIVPDVDTGIHIIKGIVGV